MNRRNFLKLIPAVAVAPVALREKKSNEATFRINSGPVKPLTVEDIKKWSTEMPHVYDIGYIVNVYPQNYVDAIL